MSKKFFKNNKIMIILYLVLVAFFLISWYKIRIIDGGRDNQYLINKHYELCKEFVNLNDEEQQILIGKYSDEFILDKETCIDISSFKKPGFSAYKIYGDFMIYSYMYYLFPYFVPILILLPFIYNVSQKFRSKIIKNYLLRDDYKSFVKKIFKDAYKNIWFIPILIILSFIVSVILSSNNLDSTLDEYYNFLIISTKIIKEPFFYVCFVLVLFFNMGMYINVGLTILSKNKNFIVALIESFLIIYLIWCISEIVIGVFVQKTFGLHSSYFSLLSIYTWNESVTNIWLYTLINAIWFIVTFVVALLSYSNKEKLIQMCEK